jgi:hypothetical protein
MTCPEKMKILEMLHEGKINTEEAATLLDALEEDNGQKTSSAPGKVLKIRVSDKD